jgi:hypothetical protein
VTESTKRTIRRHIRILPDLREYVTQILDKTEPVLEFHGKRVKDADVLLTWTFNFGPGIEADIKLCNGASPYIDAVLFINGAEVQVLEPSDQLHEEFEFEHAGERYNARFTDFAGMPTKRIHYKIETWGYGDDAKEAWMDVLDSIAGYEFADQMAPITEEHDVIRCDECGGDNVGDENPCQCEEEK